MKGDEMNKTLGELFESFTTIDEFYYFHQDLLSTGISDHQANEILNSLIMKFPEVWETINLNLEDQLNKEKGVKNE